MFDYATLPTTIKQNQISIAFLSSSTVLSLINDSDTSLSVGDLTKVIVFGGQVSPALVVQMYTRHTGVKSLRHCYLLAECPTPISVMVLNSRKYDSVGHLWCNTKLRTIRPDVDPSSEYPATVSATGELQTLCLDVIETGLLYISKPRHEFALGYLIG